LLSLLVAGAHLASPEAIAGARPGLVVAARLLLWVALIEALQALVVDLLLVRWLRRPPPPRILRDFLTLGIALAVFLVSLRSTLGVDVTSLLATSAMISVVVGLALQDTLGSFFAGLALQMESPLGVGEWVRVEDVEGRVTQVGWRTLRIVTLDGDEITFPNSLVTRSTLVNFSRPAVAHREFLAVGVDYSHPPHEVIDTLTAATRGVPGILENPPAETVIWEFGASEISYRVRYWINDFAAAKIIRSTLASRVFYGLARQGLDIAYPSLVLRRPEPAPRPEEQARHATRALGAVDLFQSLSEAECAALAARMRPVLFGRGEHVIRQGEPGDSLFVVTRGRVEVRVATSGQEAVVGTLGAGSFFGEMSLLTGAPRTATVTALEDTEVFPVRREDFRHVAEANPAVLEQVTQVLSQRRGQLDQKIRETDSAAAARAASQFDLLGRVRAFFGLSGTA
jgi:small-conductance mechanosensitive channel/CRP-like cAMP-binding protein